MTDRYVVRSSIPDLDYPIPDYPCTTEGAAFAKAAELFDEYGPKLEVQISLNDIIFRDTANMRKWNASPRS
jgi:hypothetical protein